MDYKRFDGTILEYKGWKMLDNIGINLILEKVVIYGTVHINNICFISNIN